MWCAQSATRLTAESKRAGPGPANRIFGEKLFLFFSPRCLCLTGCKWMEKHPLLKVSTGSDLHCIIQIAVKCIICSNCVVQFWMSIVYFWIHVCRFFPPLFLRRRPHPASHAWIMECCCCMYAKMLHSALVLYRREWGRGGKIQELFILKGAAMWACVSRSGCSLNSREKLGVLV